ncbi:MAG: hypothetical protein JNK57_08340, partial [Planctomycetaceae bacterium]|nr:hypothetical protein [Planctomycetaceae bacterium]
MNRIARLLGMWWVGVCCTFSSFSVASAHGEEPLCLANLFGDSMVLPSESELPIWGWSQAHAEIRVSLGEQTATTTSDEAGFWIVRFPPLKASFEPISLGV